MRAILCREYGPIDDLVLDDVPPPEVRPGTVNVRVLAAGVNYVDTLIVQGRYQLKMPTPFSPGSECVGEVIEVAADVARDAPHLTVGTRVLVAAGSGAYAEQVVAPAHSVTPVPDGISDGVAATFVQSYMTAVFALRNRADAQRGQSLLVIGAGGGVGLAAVDVGASMGLRVFAAASSEEKRQLALDKGAEVAFDVGDDDIKSAVRELVAAEGKTGVDLVYDPVGGERAETWLRTLGDNGQFLVIGFVGGIPSLPLNHVLLRNRSITGVEWGSWALRHRADNDAMQREVMAMIADGKLDPGRTDRLSARTNGRRAPRPRRTAGVRQAGGGAVTGADDPFGLRSLDIEALRAKDGAKWQARPARFSAWVADMDFPVAPAITDALREVIDRNAFGYPDWGGPYALSPAAKLFETADGRAVRLGDPPRPCARHDRRPAGRRATVLHLSEPGDGVVLHMPAYHPFLDTIDQMDRRLVPVVLRMTGRSTTTNSKPSWLGRGAAVWILCNPHNPLGYVFERAELERIAEIAERFDLTVISDEIHADLTMPGFTHVPFESLGPEVSARTVTLDVGARRRSTWPGLRWAVMHTGSDRMQAVLDGMPGHYLGAPNLMAVTATVAAWTHGDEWLAAVIEVRRRESTRPRGTCSTRHLPGVVYQPPAGDLSRMARLHGARARPRPGSTCSRSVVWCSAPAPSSGRRVRGTSASTSPPARRCWPPRSRRWPADRELVPDSVTGSITPTARSRPEPRPGGPRLVRRRGRRVRSGASRRCRPGRAASARSDR